MDEGIPPFEKYLSDLSLNPEFLANVYAEQVATTMFAVYTAFKNVGFSDDQAFTLLQRSLPQSTI